MARWTVLISKPSKLDVETFEAANESVSIRPNFYGSGYYANAAIIEVRDSANKLLSTSLLSISGTTGRPLIRDISAAVSPISERRSKRRVKPPESQNPAS